MSLLGTLATTAKVVAAGSSSGGLTFQHPKVGEVEFSGSALIIKYRPQETTQTTSSSKPDTTHTTTTPSPKKEEVDESSMPDWFLMSWDAAFYQYAGGFAVTHSRFLVSVNKSDDWWQWSFDNRYSKNTGTGGFDSSKVKDKETLKEACKKAYKGTISEENSPKTLSQNNSTGETFKEEEIWLFCSPAGEKVETLKDAQSKEQSSSSKYKDRYGHDLVSTTSKSRGNTWFWKNEIKILDPYNKRNFTKEQLEEITKDWCQKTYESEVTSEDFESDPIFKHCSFSGITPKELIKEEKPTPPPEEPQKPVTISPKDNLGLSSTFSIWRF